LASHTTGLRGRHFAVRGAVGSPRITLTPLEHLALTVIAYLQPVARMQIGDVLGKAVSRLPHELQSARGPANEAEADSEGREEADGTWPHWRNNLQMIDWPAVLQ
jgi:chromosome segregation and condensation protein ScpB